MTDLNSSANQLEIEWQALLDAADRTSPSDFPDMCLITRDELSDIITRAQFNWRDISKHGIEIQDLRELDAFEPMGFWARGHHPIHQFAEACNHYTGAAIDYDRRYVRADDCRHEWWRTVPHSGEPGVVTYHPAEPRSRGAFAVTVTTVLDDCERKRTQKWIDEHNKGRSAGFAEGLNWALRMLDNINSDAGEALLALYREQNKPADHRG